MSRKIYHCLDNRDLFGGSFKDVLNKNWSALPGGFEPPVFALRGQCPMPLDDGSVDHFY